MNIEITDYINFRSYLKDFINQKKVQNSKYSISFYSSQIGASNAYLKMVINGKRSLNLDKGNLLAQKLKLNQIETSYFITMVLLSEAKTDQLKNYYKSILINFKNLSHLTYDEKDAYLHIFTDIITWELFSLIGIDGFKDDPDWIIKKLQKNK